MKAQLIVGIAFLGIFLSGGFFANIFLMMLIGEINRKRRQEHLISYFGFTMFKVKRIVDEYRELYPRGRLRLLFIVAYAATLIGLVGLAVSLLLVQRFG